MKKIHWGVRISYKIFAFKSRGVILPPHIRKGRKIDMETKNMIPAMPIRGKPFAHQQRANALVCVLFGVVEEDGDCYAQSRHNMPLVRKEILEAPNRDA